MNLKSFIKKFKTNFSFRKKTIVLGSVGMVGIFAVLFLTLGANMSVSILGLQSSKTNSCSDTDSGKNHELFGRIYVVINGHAREEADTCNSNGTLREWFCGQPGEAAGLLRSENYVDCGNGYQCQMGACRLVNDPNNYGYGYGYNRTGNTYGYGYGYGYKKIDPKTNKPWMYLLVPFKTYTKAIYDAAISKFGFQMVKSYNKKEFTAPIKK